MTEPTRPTSPLFDQTSLTARIGWSLVALIATALLVGLWKGIATYDFFGPTPFGLESGWTTARLVLTLLALPIVVGIALSTLFLSVFHPENVTLKPNEAWGSHYLLGIGAMGTIGTAFGMYGLSMAAHESWLTAFPLVPYAFLGLAGGAAKLCRKSIRCVLGVSGPSKE